jgi:type IV pilus assembly protein PilB
MAERRTIGQILLSFGRITEADVDKALEHQRKNGGYFGEALMALGYVTPEELEWGLASQFDLPYVFPEADSIDPEAASLVSPEWALAHLTLPIMKTADSLTVVVDSPIKTKAVDELQARTDLPIELALASPQLIRELIRQVYARAVAQEELERPVPTSLREVFAMALEAASGRFGISTRKERAWGWFDDSGKIRRRPLDANWEEELTQMLSPGPEERIGEEGKGSWTAEMNREGMVGPVEVRYMGDETGKEFLFRPLHEHSLLRERFPPPPQGILSEVRLLARSGSARFVVLTDPPELGYEVLPHLPLLLLDPAWRSIYLNDKGGGAAGEAFSLELSGSPDSWGEELETLGAFHFDVVTVDLGGAPEAWLQGCLDVAACAFIRWPGEENLRTAHEAGVRWMMTIHRKEEGCLDWNLEPIHG